MEITYYDSHEFSAEEMKELFQSVRWESGNYPELLQKAMRGYQTVFSARDGNRLVGMVCAMDDGVMTAYVHYLLVSPDYQGRGIGTHLLRLLKEKYRDYQRIAIIAYCEKIPFYEKQGFRLCDDASPMYILSEK